LEVVGIRHDCSPEVYDRFPPSLIFIQIKRILRQNKQSLGPFKKRMKFDRNFLLVKQPKMRKMKSEKKGQTDPMNVDNSINTPILFYFILLFF